MKPLNIDQQIQVCRVLGWLSLMIEGTSLSYEQHAFVVAAAKELCPILNLDDSSRPTDNLWELGGLPEQGLENDAQAKALTDSLAMLVRPLQRRTHPEGDTK
ncbi:hypothetical protein LCGC14_1109810 [marine sediment metagenome]|uniref:Uncharacterized protein n=1 Tax=marine sediment metagenome TaxID=412755 RepID=A0A0F9MV05_9ZZZZ